MENKKKTRLEVGREYSIQISPFGDDRILKGRYVGEVNGLNVFVDGERQEDVIMDVDWTTERDNVVTHTRFASHSPNVIPKNEIIEQYYDQKTHNKLLKMLQESGEE